MSDYSEYYSAIDADGNEIDNMHIPLWILKHINDNNKCRTDNIENMLQSNIIIKHECFTFKGIISAYLNALWINQSNKNGTALITKVDSTDHGKTKLQPSKDQWILTNTGKSLINSSQPLKTLKFYFDDEHLKCKYGYFSHLSPDVVKDLVLIKIATTDSISNADLYPFIESFMFRWKLDQQGIAEIRGNNIVGTLSGNKKVQGKYKIVPKSVYIQSSGSRNKITQLGINHVQSFPNPYLVKDQNGKVQFSVHFNTDSGTKSINITNHSHSIKEESKMTFPTPETIWEWIKDNWRHCKTLKSPGGTTKYSNVSLRTTSDTISYVRSEKTIMLKRHRLEKNTEVLLKDGYLKTSSGSKNQENNTSIDYSELTITMWALGWKSPAGLVDNKPFPYKNDSTTFYLRYIPVDFNLFDSIMAELNLRRSDNSSEDDTVAIYEPSDWLKEEATGTWRVHVKKDATTGYNISIENNGDTTTIDLTQDTTVKQFAEYDWSTRNANTIKGETPRFYVSWPEKMLLQTFLMNEILQSLPDTLKPNRLGLLEKHVAAFDIFFKETTQHQCNTPRVQFINITPSISVQTLLKDVTWSMIEPFQDVNLGSFQKTVSEWVYKEDMSSTVGNLVAYVKVASVQKSSRDKGYGKSNQITLSNHTKQTLGRICSTSYTVYVYSEPFSETNRGPLQKLNDYQGNGGQGGTSVFFFIFEPGTHILSETLQNSSINRRKDALSNEINAELVNRIIVSKNLILEGVPGTGKTYAFKHHIVENWFKILNREGNSRSITMHPSTSYEDFLEGLRPTTIQPKKYSTKQNDLQIDQIHLQETKDSKPIIANDGYFYHRVGSDSDADSPTSNFTAADGFFLNVCKQAVQNPSKDYLVLLDEINRCNIPSVFGDLLTAIERSKRATWNNDKQCWNLSNAQTITLAISKRKFFVPENVYVVGTMNTTDRSVAPMDMALRRRFAFHRIEPDKPKQENFPTTEGCFPNLSKYWSKLNKSIEAIESLNTFLENWGKDALLGYSYIYDLATDLDRYGDHQNQLIAHHWNHHILPQLGDVIFSNQITEEKLETLLGSVTDDQHGCTIMNTSTNTENTFERPSLDLKISEE